MVAASSKAIIVFQQKTKFREDEKNQYVKVKRKTTDANNNEEYLEKSLYVLHRDYDPLELLNLLQQFKDATTVMNWTRGPQLFMNFIALLGNSDRAANTWRDLAATAPPTVDGFRDAIVDFKTALLRSLQYDKQISYMRLLKKPGACSVQDFHRDFFDLNQLSTKFPDANGRAGLTTDEFKLCFYEAMPKKWQNKFIEAGRIQSDSTVDEISAYMESIEDLDPYENHVSPPRRNNSNGNSIGNGNSNNRNRTNNSNNRNRRSQGNSNSARRTSNNGNSTPRNQRSNQTGSDSQARIQARDPCPLPGHQGHVWNDCICNHFGIRNANSSRPTQGAARTPVRESHNTETNNPEVHLLDSFDYCQPSTIGQEGADLLSQDYVESECYCTQASTGPFPVSAMAVASFEAHAVSDKGVDSVLVSPSDPLVPTTLASARLLNGKPLPRNHIFRTLIDHGASHCIVNRRRLPRNVQPHTEAALKFSTTAGSFETNTYVWLEDFRLPEFNLNRRVSKVKCFVFNNNTVPYDLILGREFLNAVGIDVKSSNLSCEWEGDSIPFKPPSYLQNQAAHDALFSQEPEAVKAHEIHLTFTATKSTVADIDSVIMSQTHLSSVEQAQLHEILSNHNKLFNGKLGCFPHREFHIDLKPGSKPYHCKGPYTVPTKLRPIVKAELDRQVKEGIIERVGETLWGMPMLCIAKKDGAIRTVDDMRELNKCILRRTYPLPKLMDMMRRHPGWRFLTVLDLTLCYYSYKLDEESSWYCVLVTPFGKYRRLRLSMGCSQSADWAQASLEHVLQDVLYQYVEAYIDDVAIFSDTWDQHINHVATVLGLLEQNGYTVNPAKCNWAVAEVEWMGHKVTRSGLKPWPAKIQGILDIAPPTTLRQLRAFIGCVNFYRDFWKKRAHVMAPLTALTKVDKKRFLHFWTPASTEAFNATKALIANDVLLAYPDPNHPFLIQTDASDYQLGAVILQHDKPVAFFSRKLSSAQRNYATPDKEAVCIIEVLHTFRDMLFGADITIETDHRNLAQANFQSQRLLKWRLAIEEFTPTIVYKPGIENTVADGLSRLPLLPSDEHGDPVVQQDLLHEVLLYYPEAVNHFPLNFLDLAQDQLQDPAIQAKLQSGVYVTTTFGNVDLATKLVQEDPRIVVPEALHDNVVHWYHIILGHCGQQRLTSSIQNHLHFPGLKDKVKSFVESCDLCQRYKNNNAGIGHLPPRDNLGAPFEEIALDHIGPWTLDVPEFGKLTFYALTVIDTASALLELTRVESTSSAATSLAFENNWLANYPRPSRAIFDAAGSFHGPEFQLSLFREGIIPVPITVKNPQSNAIIERAHSTTGDILRTLQTNNIPTNIVSAHEVIDTALASAQRAIRSSINRSMGISPGASIFHRDMLLNVPVIVDFQRIHQSRQAIADRNNIIENRRRRYRNYNIGDQVLILAYRPNLPKLSPRATGPYTIFQVHVNGTVTIQRRPGVFERLSIRRIKPYIFRA